MNFRNFCQTQSRYEVCPWDIEQMKGDRVCFQLIVQGETTGRVSWFRQALNRYFGEGS